jgi:hypothetical protein
MKIQLMRLKSVDEDTDEQNGEEEATSPKFTLEEIPITECEAFMQVLKRVKQAGDDVPD